MISNNYSFESFIRESMVPMHQIEPGLFLGNMSGAENEALLRQNRITHIVQCLENRGLVPLFPFITYCFVPVDDICSAAISQYFQEALPFIHQALMTGNRVFVHCAAGVSRSSTVVIAYFMAKYGFSFERARDMVKAKRKCVNPNNGFERQLKAIPHQLLRSYIRQIKFDETGIQWFVRQISKNINGKYVLLSLDNVCY